MRISDWSSDVCSSDLCPWHRPGEFHPSRNAAGPCQHWRLHHAVRRSAGPHWFRSDNRGPGTARSEEHTSELQSLMRISYAVFCLKKKKYQHEHTNSRAENDDVKQNRHIINYTNR